MKPYNDKVSLNQMTKFITRDEKINYLRIALSLQHIGVTEETSDRIIETYETILKLGGDFSIEDAVRIEKHIKDKYAEKNIREKNE